MASAGFLGSFRALPVPRRRRGRALAPAAAPEGRSIGLVIERQRQTNWCWAAVSKGVADFLQAAGWTQCAIVNAELSLSGCCGEAGAGQPCNQPWYLDEALERIGRFGRMTGMATPFDRLRLELDAGRPLCARIGWEGGGGHFVALGGWRIGSGGERYVEVEDPWHGHSQITLDAFTSHYQGIGRWTHSYFTGSASGGAPKGLRAARRDPGAIGG